MTDKTQSYEILLKEFNNLPKKTPRDESFISICGFPSREKVSSNILAFFLDTHREHKLKNLFVKSLLESVGLNANDYPEDFESETEVYTKNGKYIDLLLCNEQINIVIENKIYAELYNDLKDYYEKASEEGKDEPIGIVLSLSPIDESKKGTKKFKFVTYEDFFSKVKENIGNYLEEANPKYIPFLLDYFYNIENLERGENMDKEFLEFLRKNDNEKLSLEFISKIEEFRSNLRGIVKNVSQLIGDKIEDKNVKIWAARDRNSQEIFDIAVVDYYPNKDIDIALDSRLTLNGWEFVLFTRPKSNKVNLDDYIKQVGLKGKLENGRFKFDQTFDFDAKIEDVSDFIVSIINCLGKNMSKIPEK